MKQIRKPEASVAFIEIRTQYVGNACVIVRGRFHQNGNAMGAYPQKALPLFVVALVLSVAFGWHARYCLWACLRPLYLNHGT